jgi:hypothetical protein
MARADDLIIQRARRFKSPLPPFQFAPDAASKTREKPPRNARKGVDTEMGVSAAAVAGP